MSWLATTAPLTDECSSTCPLCSHPINVPRVQTVFLEEEPFVQVKQSFAIGAGAVTSFGYRKDHDGHWLKKDT